MDLRFKIRTESIECTKFSGGFDSCLTVGVYVKMPVDDSVKAYF